MPPLSRRAFAGFGLAGLSAALTGCSGSGDLPVIGSLSEDARPVARSSGPVKAPDYDKAYGRLAKERHPVAAFDVSNMDPELLRAEIAYAGAEAPGTIVIEPRRRRLLVVGNGQRAMRYGIGVGPDGRSFSGRATVFARQEWPDDNVASEAGREGWAQLSRSARDARPNDPYPFGARGLSIGEAGRPPVAIIHGTSIPDSIGTDVPSGGFRMINQDVVDLYSRTSVGTPVIVRI